MDLGKTSRKNIFFRALLFYLSEDNSKLFHTDCDLSSRCDGHILAQLFSKGQQAVTNLSKSCLQTFYQLSATAASVHERVIRIDDQTQSW